MSSISESPGHPPSIRDGDPIGRRNHDVAVAADPLIKIAARVVGVWNPMISAWRSEGISATDFASIAAIPQTPAR
jgi:hypothetical protein